MTQQSPLTRVLTDRFPGLPRRLYRRGQFVARGEPGSLLVVTEGALAVESLHREIGTLIIDVISPASNALDYCGHVPSVSPAPVVRALMRSEVLRVPAVQAQRLFAEDADCARLLAEELCGRIGELRRRVVALDEPDMRRRVIHALTYLRAKIAEPCALSSGLVLRVPQTVIASVAGISRQTTNRALVELQAEGIVRVERSLVCLLDSDVMDQLDRGEPLAHAFRPCVSCRLVRPSAPLDCATDRRLTRRSRR